MFVIFSSGPLVLLNFHLLTKSLGGLWMKSFFYIYIYFMLIAGNSFASMV